MYQPILLEKTVVRDPLLFPEAGNNVLMFLGAKASISFDERVRDVRISLRKLEEHDNWLRAGMPDEGIGEYIIPTEEEIEKARFNTLSAVYLNDNMRGLYIHCRHEDVERLFEAADKVACFLAARTPVKGKLGKDFYLCARNDAFGFRSENFEKPASVDGEPEINDNLRAVISLSANFAVARDLFQPIAPSDFPNQLFFPHVPQAIRSMLLLSAMDTTTLNYDYKLVSNEGVMTLDISSEIEGGSRIVTFPEAQAKDRFLQSHFKIENDRGLIYKGPVNMQVFFDHIFAPLLNNSILSSGQKKIIECVEKHFDIFALSQAGSIPRADFIHDFIPSMK